MPVTRVCIQCGKSFQTSPSTAKKYCSHACYHATLIGKAFTPKTAQSVTCSACGKSFELPPCKIERSQNLYCSQACMGKGSSITLLLSDAEIVARYVSEQQSMQSIANECGVSYWVIRRHLRGMGINLRSRSQWGNASWDEASPERYAAVSRVGKRNIVFALAAGNPIAGALALQKKRGPSDIERLFMDGLDKRHVSYAFQFPIDSKYLCDFYLPSRNLLVECDGAHWHNTPQAIARDGTKDAYLINRGYSVLRFTENQIKADLDGCLDKALSYPASA